MKSHARRLVATSFALALLLGISQANAHGDAAHAARSAGNDVAKEQKAWGIAGDAKDVTRTVAIRMKDTRLEWDSTNLRFTNNEKANDLLHIEYRDGWTL